jgi:hypothetical protein
MDRVWLRELNGGTYKVCALILKQLLQFRILCLCGNKDWNFGVGVFPERQEILDRPPWPWWCRPAWRGRGGERRQAGGGGISGNADRRQVSSCFAAMAATRNRSRILFRDWDLFLAQKIEVGVTAGSRIDYG